ncbi:MAG TPA: hypothetical protein VJ725_20025 [Thermoanaerobaculia bacterium]|nr:hypothetical protein [Thermoanaerobaculia bacterium]
MIRLERVRTAAAIPNSFRGPGRIDRLLLLVKGKLSGQLSFEGSVWKAAKDQLKLESGGKCAYCEAPTTTVAHGDVEHFRPKSRYWWLAYCYDNYLFSCQICNQQYKKDEFPMTGAALAEPVLPAGALTDDELRAAIVRLTPDPLNDPEGLPRADHLQALQAEQAHLPDPYLIDPEPLFRWVADPVQKEVAIAPRDASPEAQTAFAAVDRYFGLNREPLRRLRWSVYKDLKTFRDVLEAVELPPGIRETVAGTVREMMGSEAEFAGMVRYFVRDEWGLNLP